MGYCHHIRLDMDLDRDGFAAAVADIRALFRHAVPLAVGPSGRRATIPTLNDDFIGFSGINHSCTCDPDSQHYHSFRHCLSCVDPFNNNGGTPFVMDLKPHLPNEISTSRTRYWFACRTWRRPYDLAVMLAIIALKHRLGEQVEMRSKGKWNTEWSHGAGSLSGSPMELPPVRSTSTSTSFPSALRSRTS